MVEIRDWVFTTEKLSRDKKKRKCDKKMQMKSETSEKVLEMKSWLEIHMKVTIPTVLSLVVRNCNLNANFSVVGFSLGLRRACLDFSNLRSWQCSDSCYSASAA